MAKILLADFYLDNIRVPAVMLAEKGHDVNVIDLNRVDDINKIIESQPDLIVIEPVGFLKMYHHASHSLQEVFNLLKNSGAKVVIFTLCNPFEISQELQTPNQFQTVYKVASVKELLEKIERLI